MKKADAIRGWKEHLMKTEELAASLNTNTVTGLNDEAIPEIIKKYGPNCLAKKESIPWYCLFLHELTGFFSLLLWFGGILCFIGYFI